ncbi:lasso peptide biosynthesis PqqD family chaperone [Streptosporangium sp. NPDC051023]|uniref:lasso peptide biosynthesis PqqD family chaperone n=1 Tax=Streptosporangium sp. NPDC051023 TaxID=3155410 RepID=UPI003450E008
MYTLAPHIRQVETDYGLVLLDEVRGEYFNLNPSGLTVLRTLLTSGDPAEAVEALLREFSVDQAVAEADVTDVMNDMISAGILVPSRGPA